MFRYPIYFILTGLLSAQSRSITDGLTPPAIAPGAPIGVQQISELETINPYNGQLSTAIPLLTIAGRGEASFTMYARTSPGPWSVYTYSVPCANCQPGGATVTHVSAATNAFSSYGSPYSPGVVYVKHHGRGGLLECNGYFYQAENFSYVVFERPDGTEVSLWDGTQPGPAGNSCGSGPKTNRGPRFRAMDGSDITFVADSGSANLLDLQDRTEQNDPDTNTISGTLLFPNGVQYLIGSGRVNRITDRNGNFISLSYAGSSLVLTQVLDSSGRSTTISSTTANGLVTTSIVSQGAGGLPRTIRVRRLGSAPLSNYLRGNLPAIGTVGDIQFLGQYQDLITDITLPDTRTYGFKYNTFGELAEMKLPTGAYVQYDHGPGLFNAGALAGIYGTGQVADNSSRVNSSQPFPQWRPFIYRRLLQRRTYPTAIFPPDGSTIPDATITYSRRETATIASPQSLPGSVPTYEVGITAVPYIEVSTQGTGLQNESGTNTPVVTRHHFRESPASELAEATYQQGGRFLTETTLTRPFLGREIRTEVAGLEIRDHTFQMNAERVVQTCQETVYPSANLALRAETLIAYDAYGNVTNQYEYGFNEGPPANTNVSPPQCAGPSGMFDRRQLTYFLTDVNYLSDAIHLHRLPQFQFVYGRGNIAVSGTSYEYDQRPLLAPELTPLNHDSATYAAGRIQRGNLTLTNQITDSSAALSTPQQFDLTGNLRRSLPPHYAIDASQTLIASNASLENHANARRVSYANACIVGGESLTYPSVQELPPVISGGTRMSFSTKFDCFTGQPRRYTDINSVLTEFSYGVVNEGTLDGSMDRLISVKSASGLAAESQTNYTYGVVAPNIFVIAKSALRNANDELLETQTLFDGFGRATEQNQKNGAGRIRVLTEYDALHRPIRKSNPSSGAYLYTRTWFDSLSRPILVQTPDSARTVFAYGDNLQLSIDPAGVTKITETDTLGRLIRVIENSTGMGSVVQMAASPGSQATTTRYGYDSAGRLTVVCPSPGTIVLQLGSPLCNGTPMVRTFVYDYLGRLRTVNQPESSSIAYNYDEVASTNGKGNLTSRVRSQGVAAAVPVTTRYHYDGLGRTTGIQYSGAPDGYTTPNVTMSYDAHNPIVPGVTSYPLGRLTRVEVAGGTATAYDTFDPLGRVTRSRQITSSTTPYRFGTDLLPGYEYLRNGALSAITYPSGRKLTTTYDDLARPLALSGLLAGQTREYVSAATYTDHGALATLRLNGQRIRETITFDPNRLQTTGIGMVQCTDNTAACSTPQSLLTLGYSYSNGNGPSGGPNNSGNPRSQTIQGAGLSLNQTYTYDGWDRLTGMQETGSTSTLNESYCYDAFGNRAVLTRPSLSPLIPQVTTCAANDVAQLFPLNRWSGRTYDPSGAMAYDGRSNLRMDGEMRLRQSSENGNPATTYEYDGEGRRVAKDTAGGSRTVFVYDAFGNLTAEYGGSNDLSGTPPYFLHTDTLGSTRLTTDLNGTVVRRTDYWPFGQEINSLTQDAPYRTVAMGYNSALRTPSTLFTGKERDAETGLDYFGARYFSSAQGRFTSPDWSAVPQPVPYADLRNPQTLNLYSYVGNNPLAKTDPDGHCGIIGDQPCSLKQFVASLPDRVIGGLKGEANALMPTFIPRFQPSNSEQADVMANVQELTPALQTGIAMALPGPKALRGEVLPNETFVVRGGTNTPEAFTKGSGVAIDASGKLQGVSVNAAPGKTPAALSQGVPHNQVGVTTVGEVRAAGGNVTPSPTQGNPNHCTMCGVTPQKASELMRVRPNPAKTPNEQP